MAILDFAKQLFPPYRPKVLASYKPTPQNSTKCMLWKNINNVHGVKPFSKDSSLADWLINSNTTLIKKVYNSYEK